MDWNNNELIKIQNATMAICSDHSNNLKNIFIIQFMQPNAAAADGINSWQ